jgi:hypothetical protein
MMNLFARYGVQEVGSHDASDDLTNHLGKILVY